MLLYFQKIVPNFHNFSKIPGNFFLKFAQKFFLENIKNISKKILNFLKICTKISLQFLSNLYQNFSYIFRKWILVFSYNFRKLFQTFIVFLNFSKILRNSCESLKVFLKFSQTLIWKVFKDISEMILNFLKNCTKFLYNFCRICPYNLLKFSWRQPKFVLIFS